jgi:hypothetical protein
MEDQESGYDGMDMYVFFLGAGIIILLAMCILMFIPSCRLRMKQKLISIGRKFFWNGFVRSLTISWMGLLISSCVEFEMYFKKSPLLIDTNLHTALVIFSLTVAFTAFITCFLFKNKDKLETPEMQAKYINLYSDIHIKKGAATLWYQPVFFGRRIVFVVIPTLLYLFPNIQL